MPSYEKSIGYTFTVNYLGDKVMFTDHLGKINFEFTLK